MAMSGACMVFGLMRLEIQTAGTIDISDDEGGTPPPPSTSPVGPDNLETQLYRLDTQAFQNALGDSVASSSEPLSSEVAKPVLRRVRCKSSENLAALANIQTPSPKPAVVPQFSPMKTLPTREDQLNVKACQAQAKDGKTAMDWSEDQEAEMWQDYAAWCEERAKRKFDKAWT